MISTIYGPSYHGRESSNCRKDILKGSTERARQWRYAYFLFRDSSNVCP